MCPVGHRPFAYTWGRNEVPGHPDGRTTRTHRVRPSEKTAFRALSGFSPMRPSCLGLSPWRGGLRTPAMRAPASPRHIPLGLARSATHRVGMKCLGIRTALPGGRTECVPPRKPPLASSPGFPRKAFHPGQAHLEGRAPHARKEGITQTTTLPRFGHEPFADPEVAMTCPGFGPARICGRTECAPPRKPLFASSPGFPSKAFHSGQAHLEGRAPHAREGGIAFTDAYHR
jgi:hypothetical protein